MFGFFQVAMLAGLAGLALPVIAHLLSKRKYDVVSWGAMQFLQLGRKTRRRIRLEELLLLLLRMGMIAGAVFAAARPWARGGLFAGLGGGPSRDVVYILDGSYSMGWEGRTVTPHAAAIQQVHESLELLRPGDTVGVLDARDQVRPVVSPLTANLDIVRAALAKVPEPTGSSRLTSAIGQALTLLNGGMNMRRDVVVLTDGQALPWTVNDVAAWTRLDAVIQESTIRPTLWLNTVGGDADVERVNFSVDRLEISRELTVPEFTVRIQTTVRQSGGVATRRAVHFEVNGQRLDDKRLDVNLPANGEAVVQFQHQFPAVGSYVVSVVLEADNLPGDNRSDAAIVIEDGLPVLLVDGDPHDDPVRSETFFVRSALTPQEVASPWTRARVVDAAAFQPADLEGMAAVFLCNVPRLTPEQTEALQAYVAGGCGLVVAPGDRVDPDAWNALYANGAGLLPATFDGIVTEREVEKQPVSILNESLQAPWLNMFREDSTDGGFDFTRVRFSTWWRLGSESAPAPPMDEAPQADAADDSSAGVGPPSVRTDILARLGNGDPYLVGKSYERGAVLQLAAPLDDAWSTLPGRRALAPFLHEMVFLLAGHQRGRNVETGAPLLSAIEPGEKADDFAFVDPAGATLPAAAAGDELHPEVRLSDTSLAGVYKLIRADAPDSPPDYFVVNADRSESDLTPLSAEEQEQLAANGRFRVVHSVEEMASQQLEEAPRTELWAAILCLVVGLLVCEIFLTRRLVQRGHEVVDVESV